MCAKMWFIQIKIIKMYYRMKNICKFYAYSLIN